MLRVTHPAEGWTVHRRFAAALFDVGCARTLLGSVELTARLAREMGRRTLSRQTVAAWRKGTQEVTGSALFAAYGLAGMALLDGYVIVLATDPELVPRSAGTPDQLRQRLEALIAGLEAYHGARSAGPSAVVAGLRQLADDLEAAEHARRRQGE